MKPYYIYNVDGKTVLSYEKPSLKMAENGYVFVDSENDHIAFVPSKAAKSEEANKVLPDEPIDVARMLIRETVIIEPKEVGTLSLILENKMHFIPKYDTNQLREIAEHLLVYCEAQERGMHRCLL